MVLGPLNFLSDNYFISYYLSLTVEPEVIDLIQIKYGINIDYQKYPYYQTYMVSMEEFRYKYLEGFHISVTEAQAIFNLIKLRGYIAINYQTTLEENTENVLMGEFSSKCFMSGLPLLQ